MTESGFLRSDQVAIEGTTNERRCSATQKLQALFISDVHLGSKAAQAGLLLDFLRYHEAETIYLVGDIVDGWRLRLVALAAGT